MQIKDVENLAELSRIDLTENEKENLLKDFDSILAYVDMIKEAKVDDIEPNHEIKNIWREDKEKEVDFSRELLTKQFPDSQDGFLKVKKIL